MKNSNWTQRKFFLKQNSFQVKKCNFKTFCYFIASPKVTSLVVKVTFKKVKSFDMKFSLNCLNPTRSNLTLKAFSHDLQIFDPPPQNISAKPYLGWELGTTKFVLTECGLGFGKVAPGRGMMCKPPAGLKQNWFGKVCCNTTKYLYAFSKRPQKFSSFTLNYFSSFFTSHRCWM